VKSNDSKDLLEMNYGNNCTANINGNTPRSNNSYSPGTKQPNSICSATLIIESYDAKRICNLHRRADVLEFNAGSCQFTLNVCKLALQLSHVVFN